MSRYPLDELRTLERRSDPAWLWDVERARIVWANRAGLAFWGEATVLDIIDRRMDRGDAAIGRLADLAGALEPGASAVETLVFDTGDGAQPLNADCRRVALEDGRPGLLVVGAGEEAAPAAEATRASLVEALVAELPLPLVVFDRHGSLLFRNAAARDTLPAEAAVGPEGPRGGHLADWLGEPARADELIARVLRRGSASETATVNTRFGPRAHRIEARRLAAPVVGRLAVLLTLQDTEDRRRHETRQAETLAAVEALVEAADATFEIDAEGRLVEFGGRAEEVFGPGAGVLVGGAWDDALTALDIEGAVPFAERAARGGPWRELLAANGGPATAIAVSAVPVRDGNGALAGFRGLILAVDAALAGAARTAAEGAGASGETGPGDMDEFLLELERGSAEGEAGPEPETDAPPAGETESEAPQAALRRPELAPGRIGRDDAATFSAIARALGASRPAVETPPAEPPSGGATLRVVGGVEAVRREAAPRRETRPAPVEDVSAPAGQALAAGRPALVHRHFSILDVNDELVRLLGYADREALLADSNLLNLLPDERARLFSLQSRFDDRDLPASGRIEGVPLKARRRDRTTLDVSVDFDEVTHRGETATRIVFTPVGEDAATEAPPPAPAPARPVPEAKPARGAGAAAQPAAAPASAPAPEESEALSAAVAREAELRAVINSAADGIVTLDGEGRILTINPSAEAIFGLETGKAAGRRFAELFAADSAGKVEAYLGSVTAGDKSRLHREGHELRGRRADGGEVPLFVTIGRMNVEDGSRSCAVIRDISQWKETEEGLRLAKQRAEEDSSKKSDFLARISHELRTPLNAIIGFSEVMSEEKFGPIANDRYKGYLNDIRSSGGHLLSLINDLLDLSKIEAGKLELNFTSVDVARLIEQCVALLQPQSSKARVIMRVSLPDQLPPVVADERSTRQIILNLLSNAVKFTPPGGQVIVSAVVDDQGRLEVRVRDTGIGMSKEEIGRAMEPFRQIDTKGRTDHAGTGLGLPLTKALTEANRAEFSIESTPNAGTLVQITFPTNRVLDG